VSKFGLLTQCGVRQKQAAKSLFCAKLEPSCLAEGYKRRGLLCFETLILCLTAASMAQGGKEKLSAAPDPFLGFSLKDFKLVDQKFAEASIPSGQKSQIAVTLAAVLDRAFEDERLYADAKAGSDRPTSRQRREILNQSAILVIAALPNHGHLYIVRIVTSPPLGGPNGGFEIVEASPSGARFLGEGFGWGLAARRRPGQAYPTLTFIAAHGALDNPVETLHYEKAKYVR
jgi:hypothetical protein